MVKKLFLFVIMLFFIQGVIAETKNYEIEKLEDEKNVSFSKESYLLLSNFKVENKYKNRIYFESSVPLKGTSASTKGFVVSGKRINSVRINSGSTEGHYFTVSSSFNFWDNNTIRYEGGSNVKGVNGYVLSKFTLQYVENKIPEPNSINNIYYVSPQGNDRNSGKSEKQAFKTIKRAALIARAGSTVYVKAGTYKESNITVKNNGTKDKPIKFIGYKRTSGDSPKVNRSVGMNFSSKEMPLIIGTGGGQGLNINRRRYIIVKNIQIKNFSDAVYMRDAVFTHFDNIYVSDGQYGLYVNDPDSSNNRIINSYIANFSAIGLRFQNSYNAIINTWAVSSKVVSMDYYLTIYGGVEGKSNIIRGCYLNRYKKDSHSGHGISLKAGGGGVPLVYSLVEDCKLINSKLEPRHRGTKNIIFRNCELDGTGIVLHDGPSFVRFENITVKNANFFVRWYESSEDRGVQDNAENNLFLNCIGYNLYSIFDSGEFDVKQKQIIKNNRIVNSTFVNCDNLYYRDSEHIDKTNIVINTIFSGVKKLGGGRQSITFQNSNFYRSFRKPSGKGVISVNPMFVNGSKGDFRLKANSGCIDKGTAIDESNFDFDGNPRYQGKSTDIGAYEYLDKSTVKVEANAGDDVSICKGQSTVLTASGGDNYLWSTGERTKSITVGPNKTTVYRVTAFKNGQSDADEVKVSVNNIDLSVSQDVSICSGETVTLTAISNESVLWSTGATTKSIEVSPKSTTVYTVSSENSNCSSEKTVTVTVNAAPSVSLTATNSSICSGETVRLTAIGEGDFTWSTGETGSSIEVSPTSTTKYTVIASNSCSTSADITIEVFKPIDLSVSQDVSICSGETVTLTAISNESVLWSTGATTKSIEVSPKSTTVYTVLSENSNCSSEKTVTVTVNTAPSVELSSSKESICSGETVTLTAIGEGDFTWSTGETGSSIEVSPTSTTKYTVTASNSCLTSATADITIEVFKSIDLSVSQDVSICSGETVTLTAISNESVLWSTGATTKSIEVSPKSTTVYTVSSENSNCSSEKTVTVTVNTAPSVELSSSKESICSGDIVTLTAVGEGDFTWSTGETGSSIEVSPTSTTKYTVTASNSCLTSATADITIEVFKSIDLSVSQDVSICSGEAVTLTAISNESVLWSTGATTKSIEVSPKSTTVYAVSSGNSNCSSEKTVTVTVNTAPSVEISSSKESICSGDTVILTAVGEGDFTWSTGETGSSIEVSPTSTTKYTVTASNSCSTSAVADITIEVFKSIDLSVSQDVSICSGETVTLTAISSEAILWSTGATTKSIEVSPESTTVYTVSSGNSNCSLEKTVTVTVNTAPSVEISSSKESICSGDAVTLTAIGEGDFTWSTGETGSSIEVSPTSTTKYTVTASNSCSRSVTAEVSIVVNALPSLTTSGNVTINKGETVTLMANGQGDFLWSTGEVTSNINVSPDSTATYNVSLTNESGCSISKEIIVTVVNSVTPIIEAYAGEDVTVCKGKKVTLKATGGDSYLWSTGENTQNIEVEVDETKLYSVKVYKGNDYKTAYVTVYVDDSCEDNISITETSFNVYPNPVNNILNINLVGYRNNVKISIVGINGSVLDVKKINNLTKDRASYQMSFSRFAKGVYFVKLLNNGKTQVKKVMRI